MLETLHVCWQLLDAVGMCEEFVELPQVVFVSLRNGGFERLLTNASGRPYTGFGLNAAGPVGFKEHRLGFEPGAGSKYGHLDDFVDFEKIGRLAAPGEHCSAKAIRSFRTSRKGLSLLGRRSFCIDSR